MTNNGHQLDHFFKSVKIGNPLTNFSEEKVLVF